MNSLYIFISLFQLFLISSSNIIHFTSDNNKDNLNGGLILQDGEELVFVNYMFRHGIRSPSKLNDKNEDSLGVSWKTDGKNSLNKNLTNTGKRQQYILGLIQGEKYKDFLGPNYKRDGVILAFSSDRDRTIESYLAHQQGLFEVFDKVNLTPEQQEVAYPPGEITTEEKQIAEKNLFPVGEFYFYINAKHELYPEEHFFSFEDKCYGVTNTNKNYYFSDLEKDMLNFYDKYTQVLNKMNFTIDKETKRTKEENMKYIKQKRSDLSNIRDAYVADYFENTLPQSYFTSEDEEQTFRNEIEKWQNIDKYTEKYKSFNSYNSRILISRFFKELINLLNYRSKDQKKEYTKLNPKMIINSFHDTDMLHIMAMLKEALGLQLTQIPTASVYDFQLIRKTTSSAEEENIEYILRITFNHEEIYKGNLSDFSKKINFYLLSDPEIDLFCHFSNEKSTVYYIVIAVLSVVILAFLIFLVYVFLFRRKNTTTDLLDDESKKLETRNENSQRTSNQKPEQEI